MLTRLKRTAKELLGQKQWPRPQAPRPRSYEEQLYAALVRRGDVCFDVGANQGDVALFLAMAAGELGLVVAFEPVWPMFVELCRHVQLDTTLKAPVVTVNAGLADSEKEATIQVPAGEFGLGSLADSAAWQAAQPGAAVDSHQARFTTVDAFLATTAVQAPDFMKIDVEGAELLVLEGAAGLFAAGKRPLMVIEVFGPWEQAFGYGPWQPLSWLMERGYRFLFACPSGLVEHLPTQSQPFPPEYELGYNVLAYVPEAHAERVEHAGHLNAAAQPHLLPMDPPPRPNRVD
jgi:FkbM family methyltransferase